MAEKLTITQRETPTFVSRFPAGTPHYNDIKHLIREHTMFTRIATAVLPYQEIMIDPVRGGMTDGVSGMGIGYIKKFRGYYYGFFAAGYGGY